MRSPSDFADWTEFHSTAGGSRLWNGSHTAGRYVAPLESGGSRRATEFPKSLDGLQEVYFARWLHVNPKKAGVVYYAGRSSAGSAAWTVNNGRIYSRSVQKKQRGFALDELLQTTAPPTTQLHNTSRPTCRKYDHKQTDRQNYYDDEEEDDEDEEEEEDENIQSIICGRRLMGANSGRTGSVVVDPTSISDGSMKVLCHASAYLNSRVYIFGGLTAHGCPDDLWSFSQEEGLWRKVPVGTRPSGVDPSNGRHLSSARAAAVSADSAGRVEDRPPPRYNHSLIGWKDYLIVFGGDRGPGYSDDLWIFDVRFNFWERVSLEVEQRGLRPGARAGHTASVYKNLMIIYGGWRGSDGFSDIWSFNLEDRDWTPLCPHIPMDRLTAAGESALISSEIVNEGFERRLDEDGKETGSMPLARHWHIAAVFGDFLYIHGGYGAIGVLKEVWKFDLSDDNSQYGWSHVPCFGRMPSARCRHAGTALDDRRWAILGGKDALGSYFNDFYILDVIECRWQRVDLFRPDPMALAPAGNAEDIHGTGEESGIVRASIVRWWNSMEILDRLPSLHCHTMNYIPEAALIAIVGGCDGDCNAKNNTILLRRSPTAILLVDEWLKNNHVDPDDPIALAISQHGEPYAQHILKFL